MAQLVLDLNKSDISRFLDKLPHGFLVCRHLHDEATMRLRSCLNIAHHRTMKARSSKVQNQAITLHKHPGAESVLPVLTHLQAMQTKDALTLATSLYQSLSYIVSAAPAMSARFIHVVVGDGISANQKAVRVLHEKVMRDSQCDGSPFRGLTYTVIPIKSAPQSDRQSRLEKRIQTYDH